jgi:hypothetical protein
MSANEHVNPVQFYHASNHALYKGQELTPAEAAKHSGVFHGAMYYTDDAAEAKNFGEHVYDVTPYHYSGQPVQEGEHREGMGPGHYKAYSLVVNREVPFDGPSNWDKRREQ